jgi:hypothetical protein
MPGVGSAEAKSAGVNTRTGRGSSPPMKSGCHEGTFSTTRPALRHNAAIARGPLRTLGSGYCVRMNPSYPFDPELHQERSPAARGRCSWHGTQGTAETECVGEAVVSFQDEQGTWQAGCQRALESLVDSGQIEPLGQGA